MGRYDALITKCKDDGKISRYRLQGLTLMVILIVLFVNIVQRQATISSRKYSVIQENFEICTTAICLGDNTSDVAECLSLIEPTLANVTFVTERFSKTQGARRIIVQPLSECR